MASKKIPGKMVRRSVAFAAPSSSIQQGGKPSVAKLDDPSPSSELDSLDKQLAELNADIKAAASTAPPPGLDAVPLGHKLERNDASHASADVPDLRRHYRRDAELQGPCRRVQRREDGALWLLLPMLLEHHVPAQKTRDARSRLAQATAVLKKQRDALASLPSAPPQATTAAAATLARPEPWTPEGKLLSRLERNLATHTDNLTSAEKKRAGLQAELDELKVMRQQKQSKVCDAGPRRG
jgi:hypothetical protein